MKQATHTPKVHAGGLVTVAYLKAQLDEGSDHLGIFMPLLLDTVGQLTTRSFTTSELQGSLAKRHKLVIPEQPLATLLGRATRAKFLRREAGRYLRGPAFPAMPDVAAEKGRIETRQERLAEALKRHAARRGLNVSSNEAALQLLFRFLEEEQISLLLGVPAATGAKKGSEATLRERAVVAEFVQDAIRDDPAFRAGINDILEGLVLYRAAFLPDLDVRSRKFNNLKVFFDSVLVRQALGYEGSVMRTLLRETIDVLKTSGVQCFVLDKSVHEIKRILGMYEDRMATDAGRRSLRAVPMARHFLTQRYSTGDIRQMAALLETDIVAAGFQIEPMPRRIPEFTASERALAARLANPLTQDELEPRVVHDVDCVAAILLFRGSHRSSTIEDARAVFATSASLVIRNARMWWQEDEREQGIEPVVDIRALANLAWLKKPKLSGEFKERELIALCMAALRPTQATWQRFLKHLAALKESDKITSNEMTAVLVSAMSDRLLRDIEEGDPADIDAATLDEVVERVKESYAASAQAKVLEVAGAYEKRVADLEAKALAETERANTAERTASEVARERELVIDGRARSYARRVTKSASWIVSMFVIVGAAALILGHPFHTGWVGTVLAFAVSVFVLLELIGILGHVSSWRSGVELHITRRFRTWLSGAPT